MESKKGFPVISPEIRNQNPDSIFFPNLRTALEGRTNHLEDSDLNLIETPQSKAEELLLGVDRTELFKVGKHHYMSRQRDEQGRELFYVIRDRPVNLDKSQPIFSIDQVLVQAQEQSRLVNLAALAPHSAKLLYNPTGYFNEQRRYLFSDKLDALLLPMFYADILSQADQSDPTVKLKTELVGRQIDLILHEIGHMWDQRGKILWSDIPKELGAMVSASNLTDWRVYKMLFGWNIGPIIGALYDRNVGSETTKNYKVARERNASAIALLLKRFLKENGVDLDAGNDSKAIASVYEKDLFRYDFVLSMEGIADTFASSWYRKMQEPRP